MLVALVNLVLSIWNVVFRGFLIKTFWVWFLLPLFPNLPTLTILPAIGLSYLVGSFTPWKGITQKEMDEFSTSTSDSRALLTFVNGLLYSVGIAFCLLGGYIVHCLM